MVIIGFVVGGVQAVEKTERCTHNLAILSLPKRDAFHSAATSLMGDIPLMQMVGSSSVHGQIAVALSHMQIT